MTIWSTRNSLAASIARGLPILAVPLGDGLVGWVADVGKPILNGNPAVEPGYVKSDRGLSSALALPLVNAGRVVGVLALYRKERDAFAGDELVSLLELCPAIAALMLETAAPPTICCRWPAPSTG